jgi:peptidoglycan/LPS O-acetylase OafA/YrhL
MLRKQVYPLGYSPGLDGLRGTMTVAVLLAHIRHPLAPGAFVYMDVFFVMSGYFITALLLRDRDREGSIQFRRFYARRFARIVPPFAAMIAAYVAFGWLLLPDRRSTLVDAGMSFGYVMNLWNAGLLPPVHIARQTYLGHTWSLAIEEQFYLLWPALLALLLRIAGRGWRLCGSILAIALGCWAWRAWLTSAGASWPRLYNGPDVRADALLAGCALAIALPLVRLDARPRLERIVRLTAWPLLVLFAVLVHVLVSYQGRFYYYAGSVLLGVVPGVLFVAILTRPAQTVLHRVFEHPVLVFLGRIFYGMYLWHFPVFAVMNWHYGFRAGTRALIGLPLTFGLALLSYVLIERHFMRTAVRPESFAPTDSWRDSGEGDSAVVALASRR